MLLLVWDKLLHKGTLSILIFSLLVIWLPPFARVTRGHLMTPSLTASKRTALGRAIGDAVFIQSYACGDAASWFVCQNRLLCARLRPWSFRSSFSCFPKNADGMSAFTTFPLCLFTECLVRQELICMQCTGLGLVYSESPCTHSTIISVLMMNLAHISVCLCSING